MLNASRHQRSKRSVYCLHALSTSPCSTPRGIKDQNGQVIGEVLGAQDSAQRLAASKIKTDRDCSFRNGLTGVLNASRHQRSKRLLAHLSGPCRHWCSTPRGIKDQNGGGRVLVPENHLVLNASRHQRSKRFRQQCSGLLFESVLNASRHQRSKRLN